MQYLITIHRPNDYDPSVETQEMYGEIIALNREMVAAGVRTFVAGLSPAASARSLRPQASGEVLVTDGPYLEAPEHAGGFWVLEAETLEDALTWGRKAAIACRASVEVRPILPPHPSRQAKP